MVKRLLYILFAFVALSFSACKVTQEASQKQAVPQQALEVKPEAQTSEKPVSTVSSREESKTTEEIPTTNEITQNKLIDEPYQWVSFRGKVNVNLDGKQYSGNYFYVNRIDSIIYINVNVFGVELARMVATPQEVIFVNKISYEYYKGDFSIVEKYFKTKADFYTLQAVFNGWEDQLQKYSNIKFAYQRCTLQDVNRPFFTHLEVEMDEGKRNAKVDVTNVKFNVPGPTGIKIPESFTPIK